MWSSLIRTGSLIGSYGVYYLFIGLILSVIFSTNPQEYFHQIGQRQWFNYLVITGVIASLYLLFSSFALIWGTALLELEYKNYRNFGISCLELLTQGIWFVLPMGLFCNASAVRHQYVPFVIFYICFLLGIATLRRLRIVNGVE